MRKFQGRSILLILVVVASSSAALFLPQEGSLARPWKAAELMAVPSDVNPEDVHGILEEAEIHGTISMASQEIIVSDFQGFSRFELADLETRLLKGDPRRDEWINSLQKYFTARVEGKGYVLYYLPTSLARKRRMERTISKIEGSFLVRRFEGYGILPAFLVAACALFFLLKKPPRFLPFLRAFLLCFPLALSAIGGGSLQTTAAMACALSSLLVLSAWESWPFQVDGKLGAGLKAIRAEAGIPALSIALIMTAALVAAAGTWRPMAALPAVLALALLFPGRRKSRTEGHRAFIPLMIRSGKGSRVRELPGRWALFCGASACFAAIVLLLSASFPRPGHESGLLSFPHPSRYTPDIAGGTILPGYAAFKAHMDYQAGFPTRDLSPLERPYKNPRMREDGTIERLSFNVQKPGSLGTKGLGIERVLERESTARIVTEPWAARGNGRGDGLSVLYLLAMAVGGIPALLKARMATIPAGRASPCIMERKSA